MHYTYHVNLSVTCHDDGCQWLTARIGYGNVWELQALKLPSDAGVVEALEALAEYLQDCEDNQESE